MCTCIVSATLVNKLKLDVEELVPKVAWGEASNSHSVFSLHPLGAAAEGLGYGVPLRWEMAGKLESHIPMNASSQDSYLQSVLPKMSHVR